MSQSTLDHQSFRIELLYQSDQTPDKINLFQEHLIPAIIKTIIQLEMISAEQFAENEELFIEVLREVFTIMFSKHFKVSLSGKHHPPTGKLGPRYDLGLQVGGGEEGIYPIQIELVGKPSDNVAIH